MKSGATIPAPSDQGAYLFFYEDTKQFLDTKFNAKPYYKGTTEAGDTSSPAPKVLHFHGPKPHDYVGNWLGIPCNPAVDFICQRTEEETPKLCESLKAFADVIASDKEEVKPLLIEYCESTLGIHGSNYSRSCISFFTLLANKGTLEAGDCAAIAALSEPDNVTAEGAAIATMTAAKAGKELG